MTTIGKAAQASLEFLKSVNPDVQDVLVEEVEQKELVGIRNYSIWLITLSYTPITNTQQNALAAIAGNKRQYKVFEIEVRPNECIVKSMKMREFSIAA